jgi:hypothetical protein
MNDDTKIVIKPYDGGSVQLKTLLNDRIPEFLPKLPIISSVVAKTGSGKSVIIVSLIADYYVPLGIFRPQDIWYMCPSIHLDENYKKLPQGVNLIEEYDEALILELMDEMKGKKKMSKNPVEVPHVLLVLDDCIAESNENGRNAFHNNSVLSKLYSRARHYNINVITTSQKYTSLSRLIRVNSLQLIILNAIEGELDSIMDDHASRLHKKKFYEMIERIFSTGNPYTSLLIFTNAKDPRKKYIVNFERYENYFD